MSFKNPFRLKEKHADDFVRQLCYWRSLYMRRATRKDIERVPLKRLQQTLTKHSWHPLIKIAAGVYFVNVDEGNNVPGYARVSGWERKKELHVNKQVEQLINKIHFENIEAVEEMWRVCREKSDVEVTVTTKIKYKDEEVAQVMAELLRVAANGDNS